MFIKFNLFFNEILIFFNFLTLLSSQEGGSEELNDHMDPETSFSKSKGSLYILTLSVPRRPRFGIFSIVQKLHMLLL